MRVLLVDDELQVLRALERMFHCRGHEARITTSPREALGLLDDEAFDVVISDYEMSELDGAAFLSLVADSHPSVRRVLISGHTRVPSSVDAIFVTKPYTNDELLHAVSG